MEIQVLRETCNERFTEFATSLDKLDKRIDSLPYRNQAIKMIQLLKSCSTYKGIFQEVEPIKESESQDEDKHLLDLSGYSDERFYKQISRKTYNFERAIKEMPVIPQFIRYLVYGNLSQISELIQRFKLQPQDIL